jgi:hypothetical protein
VSKQTIEFIAKTYGPNIDIFAEPKPEDAQTAAEAAGATNVLGAEAGTGPGEHSDSEQIRGEPAGDVVTAEDVSTVVVAFPPSNGLAFVLRYLANGGLPPPSEVEGWGSFLQGNQPQPKSEAASEYGNEDTATEIKASAYAVFCGRDMQGIAVILPRPPTFTLVVAESKFDGAWVRFYSERFFRSEETDEGAELFRAVSLELKVRYGLTCFFTVSEYRNEGTFLGLVSEQVGDVRIGDSFYTVLTVQTGLGEPAHSR